MPVYQIHQLIYTKLNPEDSAFQKKDYHTAFLPLNFFNKTEQLIVENRIYIPSNEQNFKKQVVYYKSFNSKNYCLIYDIKSLPDERDTFGRGGIFICHVFIVPEELYTKIPLPSDLFKQLEKYTFNSRNELLSSPLINKQTGEVKPIELNTDGFSESENAFSQITGDNEKIILKKLFDILSETKDKQTNSKLIVKTEESEAVLFFNRLISNLPISYKVKFGWDTLFDYGRMMDYSLPIAAYEKSAPKGGDVITYSLANTRISSEDYEIVKQTENPFQRFVLFNSATISSNIEIEQAFQISEFLLDKKQVEIQEIKWDISGFATSNNALIDEKFKIKCRQEFDKKIAKELVKVMSNSDKLFFVLNKISNSKLTDYLEEIIENKRVSPASLKKSIPQTYIQQSKILSFINSFDSVIHIDFGKLSGFSDNELLKFNAYITKTKWFNTKEYFNFVYKNPLLTNYFTKSYPKRRKIVKLFIKYVSGKNEDLLNIGFPMRDIKKLYVRTFFIRIKSLFSKRK